MTIICVMLILAVILILAFMLRKTKRIKTYQKRETFERTARDVIQKKSAIVDAKEEQLKELYQRREQEEIKLAKEYMAGKMLPLILNTICPNSAKPPLAILIGDDDVTTMINQAPVRFHFKNNGLPSIYTTYPVENPAVRPQVALAMAINARLENMYKIDIKECLHNGKYSSLHVSLMR